MKRVLFVFACFFALIPSTAFADPLEGTPLEGSPIIPTMMEFVPMAITFSILLILMGKFVWPVVLKALDERAEKIEGSLKKAEEVKIEAEDILNEAQDKLNEARKESAGIIEAGKAAGETAREDVVKRAEEEASGVIARGYATVEAEKKAAFEEVKEESAKLAVNIAEKILRKEITPELDRAMIDAAIADMGGFND
jgi:F-type H+-transporting ATPase subunit b